MIGDFLARWRRGMPEDAALPDVEWRNLAVYVVAAVAAWWSGEAEWFIPPVVGVVVAVLGVLAAQRARRPMESPSRPEGGFPRAARLMAAPWQPDGCDGVPR